MEPGKISVVIDCTYPLVELATAHGYSKSERAVGEIAIAQDISAITLKSGNITQASGYTRNQNLNRSEYYAGLVSYLGCNSGRWVYF
ncbi:zinc-binding dehydrogenase [Nostoc sp. ChiQUE01b]|uniref:zinc-binding dehydrogenase n=1 Tax=Nostoc sp. ChiQUE01b TaxID=3075376 RepID=UPI003A101365